MELTANHWMMIAGAVLFAIGWLMRSWASKRDLKDAAIDSAWTTIRGRRTADNPTALEAKIQEIGSAKTVAGKATRAAGTVAGHFVAQAVGLVGLLGLLLGLALVAAGIWWR